MIIISYLRKNIFRTFLVSFAILLAIFISQQVIVAFTQVSRGNIPPSFIIKFIGLNLPAMMQYFLPFSLFLGILFTFIRMYNSREITAMFSLGVPYKAVFKSFFPLTTVIFLVSLVNSFWIAPYLLQTSVNAIQKFKTNPDFSLIKTGSFTPLPNTNYIIFVNETQGNVAKNIFLFDYRPQAQLELIMAQEGLIQVTKGVRQIILKDGLLFSKNLENPLSSSLIPNLPNPQDTITTNSSSLNQEANNYQSLPPSEAKKGLNTALDKINKSFTNLFKPSTEKSQSIVIPEEQLNQLVFDSNNFNWEDIKSNFNGKDENFYSASFSSITLNIDLVESQNSRFAFKYKTINEVLDSKHPYAKYEALIRLINSFSVYLMAMMAFVFGKVNPRASRSINVISSVSLYFIYLLILNSLIQVVNKGKVINNILIIYLCINLLYILLIYLLASGSQRLRRSTWVNKLRTMLGVQ